MILFRKSFPYLSILIPVVLMGEIWFAGGYVSADFSLDGEYTTNLQGRSDSEEDFITTFNPGITYRTEIAMLEVGTRLGYNFQRYQTLKELDTENFDFQLFTSVIKENPGAAFSIDDISLSANESNQRNPELGRVIRSRNYNASTRLSYRPTELYSVSTGITYSKTEPISGNGNLNTTESYDVPVDISYRYSEVFSFGIGYRMNQEDSSGNTLSDTSIMGHTLYGFANGRILPSVSGSLQFGAQLQETSAAATEDSTMIVDDAILILQGLDPAFFDQEIFRPGSDGENSTVAPYISGNLSWLISSTTSCNLGLSTNFNTTAVGQSNQGYTATIGLSHTFSATTSGNLSFSFEQTELSFPSRTTGFVKTFLTIPGEAREEVSSVPQESASGERTDNIWTVGTGLSKQVGRNTNLNVNLSYTENNSSEDLFSYDEFSVSFGIRQNF